MTTRHDQVATANPTKGRSQTLHVLATDLPESKETWCGRNANDWTIVRGGMTEGQFIIDPRSCARCVRIMTK